MFAQRVEEVVKKEMVRKKRRGRYEGWQLGRVLAPE